MKFVFSVLSGHWALGARWLGARPAIAACLLAVLCGLTGAPAMAQSLDARAPLDVLNTRFANRSTKPIFWAEGIMQPNQLDDYARAGFNTVVIRLFWQPTRDGSIRAADLEPQRAFAAAAERHKLAVIYALPPAPVTTETVFAYSGEAGPYRAMWANWAQRVVTDLRDTPNLIGWMLPDDPRSLPFLNEQSFSRWLAANYGNVGVLNSQWNARFESLEDVTIGKTRRLIQSWNGPVLPNGPMTPDQARAYIVRSQNRPQNENFAFHPAGLALAHYQWDAYRGLLDFWAKTVRSSDPLHKIFSGALPDYAQLLSVPASVDVSVPSAMPGVLEPDLASHNPHAVDIARRGGRFQAVPILSTHLEGTPVETIARLAPSWMDAALSHGANGIAFDSWQAIYQNPVLRHAISTSFSRLQGGDYAALWGNAPTATAAVVLTPLADGVTLRFNANNSPLAALPNQQAGSTPTARGVYGFGEDLVSGEPSTLAYSLRWGTAFGAVDFLSPDELGGGYSSEKFGLLKRYGVVLLPQALSISPGMAQELAGYVAGGGVIVTDLGAGAFQNGGRAIGLPPELSAMLGVVPTSLQTLAFNLNPGQAYPALLPTWAAQTAMDAKVLTAGDGPDGAAFAGPLAFGEMLPGTVPLAQAFNLVQRLPGPNPRDPRDDIIRQTRAWLTLRPFGQGSAIFAPFRLWNFWRPGHPGFDAFHGDLFARGSSLNQPFTPALTSTPIGNPPGNVQFCEVVNFPNAIVMVNHNAALNAPYGGGVIPTPTAALPPASSLSPDRAIPSGASLPPGGALPPAANVPAITPADAPAATPTETPAITPQEPEALPEPQPQPTPTPTPAPAALPAPDANVPFVPAITAQNQLAPRLAPEPAAPTFTASQFTAPAPLSPVWKASAEKSSNAKGSTSRDSNKDADSKDSPKDSAPKDAPVQLTPAELEALLNTPLVPKSQGVPGQQPSPVPTVPFPVGPFPGAAVPEGFNPNVFGPQMPAPLEVPPADFVPPLPAGPNPLQPAVAHTSGAEYFLWRNGLCIFPVGPAPTPTPGRAAPLPTDSSEFVVGSIVRPPFYHPVSLYTHVPAMEMKVLQPIPVRVQNTGGGALAANVADYSGERVLLQVWPNADSPFLRNNEWRLPPNKEGKVRVTIFNATDETGYRVAPNSRHRVSIVERSLEDGNRITSTNNHQINADAQGRLAFEVTGKSIGLEITPLR